MSVYDPVIYEKCPKCGGQAYSEGVDNGVGYVHPPLHCDCGWSELCAFEDKEGCKQCDQYENCFKELNK